MVGLLQIVMVCIFVVFDQWFRVGQLVRMIEEICGVEVFFLYDVFDLDLFFVFEDVGVVS